MSSASDRGAAPTVRAGRAACAAAALGGWLLAGALGAQARREVARTAPTRLDAITGARLVLEPGKEIERGTIVLRDGIIEAVGAEVAVPEAATEWESEGLTVYPGLIEPFAELPGAGGPPSAQGSGAADAAARTTGYPNALVHPEVDAAATPPSAAEVTKLRAAGFTSALVVPADGLWRGQAVAINLGDGDPRQNVLRRRVAQVAYLATQQDYPGSLMGAVALLRQSLLDAQWYQKAHQSYARNPAQPRPPADAALEALEPVLQGKMPVLFESRDALDVLRIGRLAREFSLRPVVVASGEEYRYLDAVAALGLPLILPVAFPEPPEVKNEPNENLEVSLERLLHWDLAPTVPSELLARGVDLAFTTNRASAPSAIFGKLEQAIERGLTEQQALAALTVAPARLLGLDRVAGTIAPGKMANLLLVEGPLFVAKPKLRSVFVDGRRYQLEESKPPAIDPLGTWQLTLETDGPTIEVTLELTGTIENITGSLSAMGQSLSLLSAAVSGKELTVQIDSAGMGQPGVIEIKATVDGDTLSGDGSSPMGPFSVRGSRATRPASSATPPRAGER